MLKRFVDPRIRLPSELVRGCMEPKAPRLSGCFTVELLLLWTSYRRDSCFDFFGVLFFVKLDVVGVDDRYVVFIGDFARMGDFVGAERRAVSLIGDLLGLNGDFATRTGLSALLGDLSVPRIGDLL